MPRYRFAWSNLPKPLLKTLSNSLDLIGDPATELRRRYGSRPKTEFIQHAWPILINSWLMKESEIRVSLVETLRDAGLGRREISVRTKAGQLDYLRSCRNAPTLRETVLWYFLGFGELDQIATLAAMPVTPEPVAEPAHADLVESSIDETTGDRAPDLVDGPDRFNVWVAETIQSLLGADELFIDDDGDIPIPRGSALLYVRQLGAETPFLNLFAPLLSGFEMTQAVYDAVNAVNLQIPLAKAIVVGDGSQIILHADLLADGLTRAGLEYAIDLMTGAADHFDTLLQGRFGGQTMFADDELSVDV